MKLLIYSDLHLEHRMFTPPLDVVNNADLVILAGDIYPGVRGIHLIRRMFPHSRVVYVPGNHELYGGHWDRTLKSLASAATEHGIDFLHDRVVSIDGIRFVGTTLWTDFDFFGPELSERAMETSHYCIQDYAAIRCSALVEHIEKQGGVNPLRRGKLLPEDTRIRHYESRRWLTEQLSSAQREKTVVITHHFPHAGSCAPIYRSDLLTAAFGSRLPEDLITRCKLWIHGHTHTSFDYQVTNDNNSTRVVCNPRGYPLTNGGFENADSQDSLLIEI